MGGSYKSSADALSSQCSWIISGLIVLVVFGVVEQSPPCRNPNPNPNPERVGKVIFL